MTGSYKPLYRKYRPQKFSELIGQESIVKTLSNAINLDKVSHAYLFTGPRGTGKTSSARIFAKSLNCMEGSTTEPCGKCANCIDITNSTSVDVIEIDAASNRKVEDARNLLEKVQFVPASGKFKIYIIDEVHMLTTEAFNTLLKTLEEPPKNLVFILATTEAHKVLNTIISRCQRFDFRRVSQDPMIKKLSEIAKAEGLNINEKALSLIAKKAFGGMRDALGLLDQASVLANDGKEITDEDIIQLLGSLSEDILFDIANTIAQRETAGLMELIDKVIQCCEPVNVIRELINYFRNLLIVKTSNDLEKTKLLVDITEGFLPQMKAQSEHFEVNEVVQIIERLSEYEKTIKNTSQQHLWLEVGLISICHRQDIQVVKDLEDRISRLEEAISGGALPRPLPRPEMKSKPSMPPLPPPPAPKPRQEAPIAELPSKKEEVATPEPEKVSVVTESISKPEPLIKQETVKPEQSIKPEQVKGAIPEKSEPELEPIAIKEKEESVAVEPSPSIQESKKGTGDDIVDLWKQLLSLNKNTPSQSIFMSLGKPVQITQEKIIISFSNDNSAKLAGQDNKLDPMKEAAKTMFGSLPNIILRKALPEDEALKKNFADIKLDIPSVKIEPPKPKQVSQIAIDTESCEEKVDVEEVKQAEKNLKEINKPLTPANLSDQARMVLDVFGGKLIE